MRSTPINAMRYVGLLPILLGLIAVPSPLPAQQSQAPADAAAPERLDFNTQIRPLLSNHCFECHGPDEAQRQAGLRLDVAESAFGPLESGQRAIVAGRPEESELVARIFATDPDVQMPPADSNRPLQAADRELLKRWIAEGAEMAQHWAFLPPVRPELPAVRQSDWIRNEIDHFTLARIEARGWRPAPEASREDLIRRLTFDLTGLPPTLKEIDTFLADQSPDAYEKLVDRLLASEHFGERLAVDWLDAARFADTNGYHLDNGRDMTAWRAWVIDAFNRNLPFDRFTVEQLAGDLLPDASLEQRIASGFHRNHMINFEGGAIPDEYHTAYILDRVNTTGTVWLGLTVGCAQCHDHKYDPLTQREFYQLYAFFNNVPENGLDGNQGNAVPLLPVPTREQAGRLELLDQRIEALEARQMEDWVELDEHQRAWEKSLPAAQNETAKQLSLDSWHSLGPMAHPEGASRSYKLNLGPEGVEVDLKASHFLDERSYSWQPRPEWTDGFVVPLPGRQAATYLYRRITAPQPCTVTISLGSQDGVKLWVNRKELVASAERRGVAPGQHTVSAELQQGQNEVLIKAVNFGEQGAAFFALRSDVPSEVPETICQLAALAVEQRSAEQRMRLRGYYRHCVTDAAVWKELDSELAEVRNQRSELGSSVRTTMVMQEMEQPRETFLLERGQYDRRSERVTAGTPSFLPPLPAEAPANRLGLARWLVHRDNPLVSRVIVNRYWQMLFGTGLVKTAEDFGSQGERPSHPALLDWLAVEFQQPSDSQTGGWNVKALLRQLVLSSTYRQSSRVPRESYERDPENRWLARGPRLRLQAEFIRDQALAASGLLQHAVGGPSVNPYQPAGLWTELSSRGDSSKWTAQVFVQSHGADLYRRSMYTFWKRTSPPPTLITFDAPDRETCTVRRSRTNTPLQALILMNDPTYVEASRALAERLLQQPGSDDSRLATLFRRLTARSPSAAELQAMQVMLHEQRSYYEQQPEAAEKLLGIGDSQRNEHLAPAESAAWTMVSSAVLNLDETVTKN